MTAKTDDWVTKGLIALVLVGVAMAFVDQAVGGHGALEEGTSVPAATFGRFEGAGGPVSLSSLKGKVVVLDFWATWCPPCREEMPMLVKVAQAYADRGVQLVAANHEGDAREARIAVALYLEQMPSLRPYVAFVEDEEAHRAFKVEALPTTYVLDANGLIVGSATGPVSEAKLRAWVELALRQGASKPP